jgi:hypothetical protein
MHLPKVERKVAGVEGAPQVSMRPVRLASALEAPREKKMVGRPLSIAMGMRGRAVIAKDRTCITIAILVNGTGINGRGVFAVRVNRERNRVRKDRVENALVVEEVEGAVVRRSAWT